MDEWEVIHAYTRKQALEDGVFMDVTALAKERGFNCSVVITCGIYAELFKNNNFDKEELNILLGLLFEEMRKKDFKSDLYEADYKGKRVWLDAYWDEESKPAITIMFPEEY